MSNDEYKRILLQVIQELRDQGWTEEEIAEADIRIRETHDSNDGDPPTMVSDIMANTSARWQVKGVYKH